MFAYVIKRILFMIPTLVAIMIITFAVVHLAPGDPAQLQLQSAAASSVSAQQARAIVEETRAFYGLDEPVHRQFFMWISRAARFDFGVSFRDRRPVMDKIMEAIPVTLLLNITAIMVVYIISIPVGVISASKKGGLFDRFSLASTLVLYSIPSFWAAMVLISFFGGGEHLNWFPITGMASDGIGSLPWHGRIFNVLWHMVLPVVCLTYGGFAFLSRFARSSILRTVDQDYIMTARAKGLPEWRVLVKHAMRNALIPFVTLIGALLPALIGGSVIIEEIFSIPGMGRLGFESVLSRDYPVIMAIAFISALLTLLGMLVSDMLCAVVDPRISVEGRGR